MHSAQSSDQANLKFLRVLGSARWGVAEEAAIVRALWGPLSPLVHLLPLRWLVRSPAGRHTVGRWLLCVRRSCLEGVTTARKKNREGPGRPSPGPPQAAGALEPAPPDLSLGGFQALLPGSKGSAARATWIAWPRWAARGCGGRCWGRGRPVLASAHTRPEPRPPSPAPSRRPTQPRLPEPGLATGGCGAWKSFPDQGSCASYSSC